MTVAASRREDAERREHEWLAPFAVFSDTARERPCAEPSDPFRTCFVRDRDRVLHCGAFRRLKDKTQVFVFDEGDNYRTRLTHTLEVSQMARFLALALRVNPNLAEVLAFVHDIGHPPFGHMGEKILAEVAGVPFDHNRQALRLVDVIEQPYADGRRGLNLTQTVRRSILKHGGEPGRGASATRQPVLEAQITDLADSTAYHHHDLEDALSSGLLAEEALAELPIWAEAVERIDPPTDATATQRRRAILSRMLKTSLHDVVEASIDALARSGARDVEDVVSHERPLIRRGAERARMHTELAAFLHERFYRHPRVLRSEDAARDAIATIVEHFTRHPDELPHGYRARVDEDGLGRVVCDYVAGMTDRFALDEGQRLTDRRRMFAAAPAELSGGEAPSPPDVLEARLGYTFRDRDLIQRALTHRSARTETLHPNERLEFLGDSVLGLVVAEDLFRRYPDREEGELSRIRSSVVSRRALHRVAGLWGLQECLLLGPGMRAAQDPPPSVAADAVEAVLGAVYLDGGLEVARDLVVRTFEPLIVRAADRRRSTNHKSALQTFSQGRLGLTPHYRLLTEEGPDHAKTFTVSAVVGDREVAVAEGRNKREAEQAAAKRALEVLTAEDARSQDAETR